MTFNREILRAASMSAAVAVVLGMQLAVAEDKPKGADPRFDKLDKNRDGYLSRDEVRSLRDYDKAFEQADENKDGKLDRAEFVRAEAIHDRLVTGKYVDDSLVTAKVKAALLREPELNSMDVSVETQGGEVMLSGFVQDDKQRQKALKIASSVSGVASIKDAMRVR